MPLVCNLLDHGVLSRLNALVLSLNTNNPLRKECVDGDVRVFVNGQYLVLHSAGGFYFEHMITTDLESELARHINAPRKYHCTAFEVDDDDPSVVTKLLDRFQEQHGLKMRNMIDWCVIKFNNKELMLCKLPPCLLRHMLAPTGGLMKTGYSGPATALANIPTLAKLGVLSSEFIVDGRISSMFVTEYKEVHYNSVQRLHWDIVREVIARPYSGISLSPVAVWDA